MSSYCTVIMVGRVGKTPEMRKTQGGRSMCSMRLAVSRFEGSERKEVTDWFSVVAFDQIADTAGKHVGRGDLILIEGRVQMRQYEDKDGKPQQVTEVVASRLRLFPRGRPAETNTQPAVEPRAETVNSGWAFDAAAVPF